MTSSLRTTVKKVIPTKLFNKIEPTGHLAESIVMNVVHGFPSRDLHVIGVTGTNGKTTTAMLIHNMLNRAGYKVGLLSTVAYGVGDDIKPETKHMTTANAGLLQKRLKDFKKQGVEWVVIETSSHALAQHRIWGIPYEIAVMTNLTRDHLDYHGTFDEYGEAKIRLFEIAGKHGYRLGIGNADDPNHVAFTDKTPNRVTYGIEEDSDIRVSNIHQAIDHVSYKAKSDQNTYDITVNIPGRFNVYNSLAALAVGEQIGLSKAQIEKGISSMKGVEGRMQVVDEGQKFKVLVDFASTPDGFERFFESVRPAVKGKLVAVFGSAGRRDESKRALQGEIAGKYADVVVLTEEDDRDVDGKLILKEIAKGATKAGKKEGKDLFVILDREEAIGFAMTQVSESNDMVALLGKGHEKTIERKDGTYPWDEAGVARAALLEIMKNRKPSRKSS